MPKSKSMRNAWSSIARPIHPLRQKQYVVMVEESAWTPIWTDVVTPVEILQKPRRLLRPRKNLVCLRRSDGEKCIYLDTQSIIRVRSLETGKEFNASDWLNLLLDDCQ